MLYDLFADPDPSRVLPFTHDARLVALSIALAIVAAVLALQVASLASTSWRLSHRLISIGSGAVALGGGVWAMHFVAMMAVEVCFATRYDLVWTAASALPALLAAALALSLLSRDRVTRLQLVGGGLLVGSGIGLMHYGGMMAMRMTPLLRLEPVTFIGSVFAAVLLSTFALWIREALRTSARLSAHVTTLIAGTLMGGAIASMHYIGMAAVRFVGEAESASPEPAEGLLALVALVAVLSVVMGVVALGGNTLLRYRLLLSRLAVSEARLQAMFDTAVDGILTIDAGGRIRSINRSALTMLRYEAHQLIGHNVSELMPEPYRSGHDGYLHRHQAGGAPRVIGIGREVTAQRSDGTVLPVRLAVGRVESEDPHAETPDGQRYVGFLTDISALKEAQAVREHEANHDALTGLPNRRAFFLLLETALHRVRRHGQSVALLFIDLDGFKAVNDHHGHRVGDQLLIALARRLSDRLRQTDTFARLGGDEFVVLLEGLRNPPEDALPVAQALVTAAGEPVLIETLTVQVGASIGVAWTGPDTLLEADTLVQRADDAMYRAKRAGRFQVCLDTP